MKRIRKLLAISLITLFSVFFTATAGYAQVSSEADIPLPDGSTADEVAIPQDVPDVPPPEVSKAPSDDLADSAATDTSTVEPGVPPPEVNITPSDDLPDDASTIESAVSFFAKKPAQNEDILSDPNAPFGSDGLMNNEYWAIVTNSVGHAKSNVEGITKALQWASENSVGTVRFPKEVYYVDTTHDQRGFATRESIIIPSGLDIDLNEATLKQIDNSSHSYAIFVIFEASDIKIHNGHLVGDKDGHSYIAAGKTHEHGYGMNIRGASNIEIYDMDINSMTGDAIIIAANEVAMANGGILSTDIVIRDSRLHDCRRQGISIIGADRVKIENNDIYNIRGTAPQSGIDLEGEVDWPVANVHILNNNFNNTAAAAIIVHQHAVDSVISGNNIDGRIGLVHGERTTIVDNTIQNGGIASKDTAYPINTLIEQNHLINSEIVVWTNYATVVRENDIIDGKITFSFANGAIYGNRIINTKSANMDYAIQIYADKSIKGYQFQVVCADNEVDGKFRNETLISKNVPNLLVSTSESDITRYINAVDINENPTPLTDFPFDDLNKINDKLSPYMITGIVVGAILVAGLLFFVLRIHRNNKKKREQE